MGSVSLLVAYVRVLPEGAPRETSLSEDLIILYVEKDLKTGNKHVFGLAQS